MKRCVIVSGSPEFAAAPAAEGDYVIACDRGLEHALSAGMPVHLVMGDMDSIQIDAGGFPQILLPPEKDDTDTLAAVRHALKLGYREFLMLGCLGGRADHQFANFSAAAYVAADGGRCTLIGREMTVYVFGKGRLEIERKGRRLLSVFSYGDRAEGVCLRGVRYPLEQRTVSNLFPIGVSNEFADERAEISLEKGILLVMVPYSREEGGKN